MRKLLLGAGLLMAAALFAGCGSGSDSGRFLEQLLPRVLGPAQRYEVRVSGASENLLRAARVRASRLTAGEGLVLDTVQVDLANLRFNRREQELLGADRADFWAVLLQEDLNVSLRDRVALIRDLRIRLIPGAAQIRGSADIPGVHLPIVPEFTLDGRLEVDDLGRLQFQPDRVHIVGIQVPALAGKFLATQINPLLDLGGMRTPVRLTSAETANGEVRLRGRALVRAGRFPIEPNR